MFHQKHHIHKQKFFYYLQWMFFDFIYRFLINITKINEAPFETHTFAAAQPIPEAPAEIMIFLFLRFNGIAIMFFC